ncbi:MAG: hypothetical protein ACLFNC_04510 [Halodesulfurarchaeum sp.]
MGLRCSLLGHAYGEPVTERDRERRGDEEVVTVRKLRTCKRCGAESVLSENTEVRHLDSVREGEDHRSPTEDDDQGPVTAPEPTTASAETTPGATESDTDESTEADVAEIIETAEDPEPAASDSQPTDPAQADAPAGESVPDASEPVDPDAGSAEAEPEPADSDPDDGIIIEDSAEPAGESAGDSSPEPATQPADSEAPVEEPLTGRDSIDDIEETGAEAETDSTAESESMFGTGAEPTTGREQDSTESEPGAERDAWKERPETETGGPADLHSSTDQAAEGRDDPAFQFESPGDTEDGNRGSSTTQRGPSGIASEGPIEVDVDAETPYASLVCPECGFSEAAVSSLRAGDICPECHRGYLAGRR